MATFKMYELRGSDACAKKRNFGLALSNSKDNVYKKAVAIKEAIHKMVKGEISTDDEIDAVLDEGFNAIPYASDKQRELLRDEAKKTVKRYVKSENTAYLTDIISAKIPVTNTMDVEVSPDFIRIIPENNAEDEKLKSPKMIEVIKIKTNKPDLTQLHANMDIGLYAMFLYAMRFLLPEDKDVIVSASYYYLYRNDDSFGDKPNFEEFYFAKGGGNVVSYSDQLSYGDKHENKEIMEKIHEYETGIPEEECTKADCEHCMLYDMCKFTVAPTIVKKPLTAKSINDLLLTPKQEEAINYREGIVRINAGAGAGKTTVIAVRVAAMLLEGVNPEAIFLVTFSNTGAEEMRSRIKVMCEGFGVEPEVAEKVNIFTFNAFGNEIIKKDYAKVGFKSAPAVIDETERSSIIARLLNENFISGLNYRNFNGFGFGAKGAIDVAKDVFDICKKRQYGVSDYLSVAQELKYSVDHVALKAVIALFDKYDDELRKKCLIEFSDQMILLLELIHQDPYYMEQFKFEHIIVDEFQDSDQDQIEILNLLTETPTFKSLMVVGDDSQAIFSFRDTSPDYIINFDKYMRNQVIDTIDLVENHRSTPQIIDFANKINGLNTHRVFKDLVATRPDGKPVIVKGFLEKADEVKYVTDGIKERLAAGQQPETIAVIVSNNAEVDEMAGRLETEGIPVVTLSPLVLMDNSRVKAAMAFFRAYEDPTDTRDSLVYANATIGGGILGKPVEDMRSLNEQMMAEIQAIKDLDEEEAKKKILEMLMQIDSNEDEIYASFIEKIKNRSVNGMLDYIRDFALYGKNTKRKREHTYPGVVVTTAHSSKGLEWSTVYNMISGYDKANMSRGSSRHASADVEEKRRLLFVSSTRARDELIVTARYVAFGKKGAYTYNQFLIDSYGAVGQTFSIAEIENERALAAAYKKALKEEAKKKAEEEKGTPDKKPGKKADKKTEKKTEKEGK